MKHIFQKPTVVLASSVLLLTIVFPLAYIAVYHLTAATELDRFNREAGRNASLADDMTDEASAERTRKLLDRNRGPLPQKKPSQP